MSTVVGTQWARLDADISGCLRPVRLGRRQQVVSHPSRTVAADTDPSRRDPVQAAMRDPHPKAFVSHATEDKDRFVLPFAAALRAAGVDAWVDVWEMQPGDSLVDKIFEEGIGGADAVIVVVSRRSLTRRWVQEELDAAVVKRINTNSRLIPVVIDDVGDADLPAAIRHLIHVRATEHGAEDAARRIADLLFGGTSRPPLGAGPVFAATQLQTAPGLNVVDSTVLKAAGDEAVRDFGDHFDTPRFAVVLADMGVGTEALLDSLEVLDHDGLVKLRRTLAAGLDGVHSFQMTMAGFEMYFTTYVDNYATMFDEICAAVVNLGDGHEEQIAETTGHPPMVVLHTLRRLEAAGMLHLSESMGGPAFFHGVSPKLRRLLDN